MEQNSNRRQVQDEHLDTKGKQKIKRVIADCGDLTNAEKVMCDDLILKLARKGLLQMVPDDNTRAALWKSVFNSWNTDNNVHELPDEAPNRKLFETAIRIGVLTENISPSTPGGKRARDGSARGNVHPNRRGGQPVFIRPALHGGTLELGVNFNYVDKGGKPVPTHLVRLSSEMTIQDAIAQVLRHFELHESKRVNDWNFLVITAWARRRLRVHLGHEDNTSVEAARLQASSAAPRDESERLLVQFVSALACFDTMRALITSIEVEPVPEWTPRY